MPGNVAVDEPGARVVELESDGEVAVAGQGGDVTAGRVGEVEFCGAFDVGADGLADDPKVVAVEVDGVEETGKEERLALANVRCRGI